MKLSLYRPWRAIGLWDIDVPTFCKQSAHRLQWRRPYAPAALYLQEDLCSFLLEAESTHSTAGRIRSIERSSDLIGSQARDSKSCSIVPEVTTLSRFPATSQYQKNIATNRLMNGKYLFNIWRVRKKESAQHLKEQVKSFMAVTDIHPRRLLRVSHVSF
jgi:hypothetical protein